MKLKGINVFEQHVEKIVLGAAVVGAGGLAAWQFLNAPEVKVGSRSVSPRISTLSVRPDAGSCDPSAKEPAGKSRRACATTGASGSPTRWKMSTGFRPPYAE